MNPRPISVSPLPDYNLLVTFQTGEQRVFNVKPLLQLPMYQPLENPGLFKLVKTDGSCVYWNDDIDLCPDMTYLQSRKV